MNRVQINWRKEVREIGSFDLVISTLLRVSLAGYAFLAPFGFSRIAVDVDNENTGCADASGLNPEAEEDSVTFAAVFLTVTGLMVSLAVIQVLAAVRLINSTELECHPLEALRLGRYWRTVNIISMIIFAPYFAGFGSWPVMSTGIVWILTRGLWAYIVLKYTAELEAEVDTVTGGGGNEDPPGKV